ncbi:RES domain-containing protein [Pseudovibrio sp. Ad26]|uniref:RES domain-containing protein n=1 Tax=Pseudovibrio sp. Ad26 TaxID=989410 RepID=UPI0007B28E09|nr:RES domain-containing protein [Pseudovibrio sp. Ad26]KZK96886.1 RES domain protein [Pseudovibrio sp. Ad26]
MNNKHAPYTLDEMLVAIDLVKRQQTADLYDQLKFWLARMLNAIGLLRGHLSLDLSDPQIETHLTHMMNGSLFNTWKLNARSFRLRHAKNGKLETDISGLVAKDPPHSEYGRCNTKENSAYYAALNIETALLESRAKEGELYQVLEMSPKQDVTLDTVIVGWLDYYRRHNAPPHLLTALHDNQAKTARELIEKTAPEEATRQIVFDAFIADQFRKIVSNHEGYRATALYSSLMLETGMFEQILYPSVANFGGWNVAIRPELVMERLEITSVQLVRVDKDLGYGMYDCTVVGRGELSGSKISWTYGDDYISKGGESPFFRDTMRNPFSHLSYDRRVEKALDSLPNDAGKRSFLYVLNVDVADYDGSIVTDDYVFIEFDDQSLSAFHDLLEVCDLDIRKDVAKNARYLLATDHSLKLDRVERQLQDEFGKDLTGPTRSVICTYNTPYRDWGGRFKATENRLSITVRSIDEISKLCHG